MTQLLPSSALRRAVTEICRPWQSRCKVVNDGITRPFSTRERRLSEHPEALARSFKRMRRARRSLRMRIAILGNAGVLGARSSGRVNVSEVIRGEPLGFSG